MERYEVERRPGNGHERATHGAGRGIGDLFRELTGETTALLRAEVALARSEIGEKVEQAKTGVTSMLAGSVVLFAGILGLMAAAILALSRIWPAWAAALVVGGAVTLIGLVLVLVGRSRVKTGNLTPDRTMESLHATKRELVEERRS
jgi:uncharacterized membrane protein YqjE